MKILLLNYEFPPLGGGAGNATLHMLKEFSKYNNLEIDLVTSSVDKYKLESFSENIRIYKLPIGKNNQIHYQSNKDLLTYSIKAHTYCKKLLKQNSYQLVHAFFSTPCGIIAYRLKQPYIVSLRGSDVPFYNQRFRVLDKLVFQRLSKTVWKNARAVIANSNGLKQLAFKTLPNFQFNVIYNGIDIERFIPKSTKEDTFTVLSTSRLIRRKGIEFLIKGFAKFIEKSRNSKLVLVGDGDQKGELINLVNSLGITNYVEFLGSVPHDEIAQIYRNSDAFVLPSFNEGMSNSILEAMASGLPIISTSTGGSEELVSNNNGFIVEKENSEQIAEKLFTLYSNRELVDKMGNESRKKAETMSWSNMAKEYFKIYKNV